MHADKKCVSEEDRDDAGARAPKRRPVQRAMDKNVYIDKLRSLAIWQTHVSLRRPSGAALGWVDTLSLLSHQWSLGRARRAVSNR